MRLVVISRYQLTSFVEIISRIRTVDCVVLTADDVVSQKVTNLTGELCRGHTLMFSSAS